MRPQNNKKCPRQIIPNYKKFKSSEFNLINCYLSINFRLTFRDSELEVRYCAQRDYMFKSSLFSLTTLWALIFIREDILYF